MVDFYDVVKPSFELDFWLRHFRGLEYEEARGYESWIDNPVSGNLFFADTPVEYLDITEGIDIVDNVKPNYPVTSPKDIFTDYGEDNEDCSAEQTEIDDYDEYDE